MITKYLNIPPTSINPDILLETILQQKKNNYTPKKMVDFKIKNIHFDSSINKHNSNKNNLDKKINNNDGDNIVLLIHKNNISLFENQDIYYNTCTIVMKGQHYGWSDVTLDFPYYIH